MRQVSPQRPQNLTLLSDQLVKIDMGTQVKNRRLAYMMRLQKEDYFSPESILNRSPLIFEQYMGHTQQPMSSEPRQSLSSILMHQGKRMEMKKLLEKHRAEEDETKSEHDSDEEAEEGSSGGNKKTSDEQRLRDLTREMEERFLDGLEDFDYDSIDKDEQLDDDWIDQRGRDAEDSYFDEGEDGLASKERSQEVHMEEGDESLEEWETMKFEAQKEEPAAEEAGEAKFK